ncbi:hypothetical protein HYV64_03295 [Candidatus Shapirobacteria bacterium]|nr:hypothetical protein [Candidatus Shapirobacteria bacterium]
MKLITIAVVVSLIFYFISRPSSQPTSNTPLPNAPSSVTGTAIHPLSIESLSMRRFPFQKLKLVKTISPSTQVVSYLSDDLTLNALMITPSGTPPTNGWPVVIVNHGFIPHKTIVLPVPTLTPPTFLLPKGSWSSNPIIADTIALKGSPLDDSYPDPNILSTY